MFVSTGVYRKVLRLDIRHHYTDEADELRPTKKGVNLPLADLETLIEGIEVADIPQDNVERPNMLDIDTRNPIFVTVSNFKNEWRLDVRHYYDAEGEWKPTRKGVSIPFSSKDTLLEVLREIAEAVGED
jgi:hypothetical protein